MSDHNTLEKLRALKPRFPDWNLTRMRLFGSRSRQDYNSKSDVDLLVEFSQVPSLFKLARIQHEIEDVLGVPVDLVFPDGIFPALRDKILEDAHDV